MTRLRRSPKTARAPSAAAALRGWRSAVSAVIGGPSASGGVAAAPNQEASFASPGGAGPARPARRAAPRLERLGQEVVHAGGEAGAAVVLEGVGGQRHDRRCARPAARRRARRRRGRPCPACACPSGSGRRRGRAAASMASSPLATRSTIAALAAEQGAGQQGVDRVVLGQQHPRAAGAGGARRVRPRARAAARGARLARSRSTASTRAASEARRSGLIR